MKQPNGKRKLASIRFDLGLTQEDMAKAIGISYSAYQKKEQGKAPLLAMELKIISEMSDIQMEDIEIPC